MEDALKYLLTKEKERVLERQNVEASSGNQKGVDDCKAELGAIYDHIKTVARATHNNTNV